jgi:hypothetical protein
MAEATKAFRECFYPNEIYFPQDIALEIKNFEEQLFEIANERWMAKEDENRHAIAPAERRQRWQTVRETLVPQARSLFEKIRAEFRSLIGDAKPEPED